MKKLLIIFVTVAMLATTLIGCGSSATTKPTESETDSVKSSEQTPDSTPQDVTIWYYWETEGHQVTLNQVIDSYNQSQSDLKVTAKYVPFADFKKQLSIGATVAELPDLVIIDAPDHASYAMMGIFADITDRVDVSKYFDGPIASATLDGKLYGIPFGSNCLSLYYNTDMLETAGVEIPKTWDELKDTAIKLTKDNVSGLAFSSVQNEEGTFNFMPWVWSTGATSFEIGSDQGIRALALAKDLVESGAMTKEVINWTQGDIMNQFISGNLAMMINGPWQVPTMRQEAPNLNWDVALIPKDAQNSSTLGGENYAVIADGNEEGALSFLKFATNEENIKTLMTQFGYISSREDIAGTQFDDDAIMKKFTEQMKYAQPRGPHPEWPAISDAISLAFNEVIAGGLAPEKAATKAQETIDSIIK